jgi:hypothetical protein
MDTSGRGAEAEAKLFVARISRPHVAVLVLLRS